MANRNRLKRTKKLKESTQGDEDIDADVKRPKLDDANTSQEPVASNDQNSISTDADDINKDVVTEGINVENKDVEGGVEDTLEKNEISEDGTSETVNDTIDEKSDVTELKEEVSNNFNDTDVDANNNNNITSEEQLKDEKINDDNESNYVQNVNEETAKADEEPVKEDIAEDIEQKNEEKEDVENNQEKKESSDVNENIKESNNVKDDSHLKASEESNILINKEQNDLGESNPIEVEEKIEDKDKGIVKFKFDGVEYKFKERSSVIEEKENHIEFRVVNNDNTRENMMVLTGLKNIFQKQLPKMPKEYIARLVYDRSHISMTIIRKPLTVVGGITYRPFEDREFAEIVFCAISSTEQVRGYGAHLMNHLKDYVRSTTKIKYFLTYADNYAIGYFKKQGFTKVISLDKKIWMGYIKDYEGGTLMQCSMLPRIRYLDAGKILLLQEAALLRKIMTKSKSHLIRPGLQQFRDLQNIKPIDPMDIPGLKEAGWTPEMDKLAQQPKRGPHYAAIQNILTELQNHASAWPFLQPVNKEEVPDYYDFIKEPMDLSTMEVKLENNCYAKMEDFIYDARLVFNNCRKYNGENTSYFKYANRLEKFFVSKIKEIPEYSQLVD